MKSQPYIESRFPSKMLVATGLAAVLLFVFHWQAYFFNERFGMDPAIPMLVTLPIGFLFVVAWGCWFLFFAKRKLVGLLVFAIPIAFFTFYYPNVSGDMGFLGFRPRFWSRSVDYQKATSANLADVKTTTKFDFPQFLGPDRNARIDSVKLAGSWNDSAPEELWKIGIGDGWSAFVAVNGNAITQEQRGADECVTCYDVKTGELKWINQVQRRHEDIAAMGKAGPRATPTVFEGLVYAASGTGVLDCIDGATGKTLWTADVPSLVGIEQVVAKSSLGLEYTTETSRMVWGRSNSPLIVGDWIVVAAGGPSEIGENDPTATLIAFDRITGEEIWRGGKRMIAYGSPTLATLGGKQQILLVAEDCAVGHDAETGEELWSHSRPGSTGSNANCSQVTIVDENRLILSKGYGAGGELIQVTESNGKWKVESIKKDPRILRTKLTNPVIHDGFVYSLSDGYLICASVDNFQRKWKERGRFGNGQLLMVGDKLLVHSEFGTLFLIDTNSEKYTELGSIDTIGGICWNTICLYGDCLLVRSDTEAACFRIPLVQE
ncbi:MAG: outer membrane protein assembly factor BamB [Mariniblastus sp.]|jgi:outer membrane protein assembly factor BamB